MQKYFYWLSIICQPIILMPFLFSELPIWYPQWTITAALMIGALTATFSTFQLALNHTLRKRFKSSFYSWTQIGIFTLYIVEISVVIWWIYQFGKGLESI